MTLLKRNTFLTVRRISFIGMLAFGWLFGIGSVVAQKKSVFIGIDGMGFGDQGFSVASTPHMDSLINGTWLNNYRGAYTDQAFAGGVLGTATQQPTVSGPGWSTMMTGVWTDRHKVTNNGATFKNGDYVNNPVYLATLKEAIPTLSTASYVWWHPIENNIIASVQNDGNSNNDLDFHESYQDNDRTVEKAVLGISDVNGLDPDVVFISVDLVDAAGHASGSSSVGYKNAIQKADDYVGDILAAISSRPDFTNEDWQILVTADHGHRASGGHGGQSTLERTIPFIVSSQSLKQGTIDSVVSHADASPTILAHFNVAIPSHYYGVSQADGAKAKPLLGDFDLDGDIDGQDWLTYVGGLSADLSGLSREIAYSMGDLNGDFLNNHADFLLFKDYYEGFNGTGSFAEVGTAVPEPNALVLMLLGIGSLVVLRSTRY